MVPGLWLDLDLAYGQHAASTLPQSDGEALDFLTTLPAEPSLIVHSGGGPVSLLDLQEALPDRAGGGPRPYQTPGGQFTYMLVQAGKERGWTLDALGDLARVLRPPGTINYKYGKLSTSSAPLQHGTTPATSIGSSISRSQHARRMPGRRFLDSLLLWPLRNITAPPWSANRPPNWLAPIRSMAQAPGDNFNVHVGKGLWHCWRHGTGGDALSLIAVCEGLIACEDLQPGVLEGARFSQVLDLAQARFGWVPARTARSSFPPTHTPPRPRALSHA